MEDADLEDDEDANLEDGCRRHAALLAKRRREAPPTMLALVRGRMERRHAKRVAHRGNQRTGQRRLTTLMLARPALATTTTMTVRLSHSFKLSGIQV
jgi:hypothetical protein